MIEFDQVLMAEAADDVQDMSDGLEEAMKDSHPDSLKSAIERSINDQMANPILQRARELGQEHVGDRVSTIKPVDGTWKGDVYTAGIASDNDVVLSHEYGSGQYNSGSKYKIEPDGDGVLAFSMNGRPVVVEYVLHPGVRGKHFMRQAVRERSDQAIQDAADEAQQTLDDALSN